MPQEISGPKSGCFPHQCFLAWDIVWDKAATVFKKKKQKKKRKKTGMVCLA
jgi:hypothetical protein